MARVIFCHKRSDAAPHAALQAKKLSIVLLFPSAKTHNTAQQAFHLLPKATMPKPSSPGTVYPIPVSDEAANGKLVRSNSIRFILCVCGRVWLSNALPTLPGLG